MKSRARPLFAGAIMFFIVIQIVALTPATLEQAATGPTSVSAETLKSENAEPTLAPEIPKEIPEYTVDGFHYVSTQGGRKQWKILAERADMFNALKLVHARVVTAYLFDSSGKVTTVTGREAKYFLNRRDIEIFGDVRTEFPDGFVTYSDYLRYQPSEGKAEIPHKYFVRGETRSSKKEEQRLAFTSYGLHYAMNTNVITLLKSSRVRMIKTSPKSKHAGVPDETVIESDRCVITRNEQLAHFTMEPERPLETRFVRITQPGLFAKGRWADLSYGNYDQLLEYLVAHEDVLVQELEEPKPDGEESLKYATAGKAAFDTRKDVIVLTEFPQAYQDHDTVTGDVILVHRDSDIVEVEHSNAYSSGAQK